MAENNDTNESKTLKNLDTLITGLVQSDLATKVFGAPVLSATGSGKPITITPNVNTKGKGGKGANKATGVKGNNAIFNKPLTTEVEQVTVTIVRPKIAYETTEAETSDEAQMYTNMYIVVGVIGGIYLAVGAGVLTFFLVNKQKKNQNIKKIDIKTIDKGQG